MATCAAYNCSNRIGTTRKDITFHRFPLTKPDILAKWLTAMRKEKWHPTKNDILCSDHFTDDQFVENNSYRFLMFNAVPTKFEVLCAPKTLFPQTWLPRMLTIRDIESDNRNGYVIEARVPLKNKEEFYEWLKEHESCSQVNYVLLRNYPITAKNLSFKAEYICQFGSTPDITSSHEKKNCPARLLVRIRADPKFRFQNRPGTAEGESSVMMYPCTIVLYHLHNHNVGSNTIENQPVPAEEVSSTIKQKFIEMFKGGYSVDLALATHQRDLYEEYSDEYEKVLNDPYTCPTTEWVNNFYLNFLSEFEEWTDDKILTILKDEIEDICASKGKASMCTVGENMIIALCTPLMQRAHSLKSAGEIVFVDSTGFLDRCHCYVYVLMAYSCTEGLPLGLIITTSDTEDVLTVAFNQLADLLPNKAFGQFGRQGPEVFLTSNDEAQQNSLKNVYPDTAVLLCSYNMSQAFWRWLWNPENAIEEEDRCNLFMLMHNMLKVKNATEFSEQCDMVAANDTAHKYANFQSYFEEIKSSSDLWAVCFKNEIIDKDKEISAIEMACHVLKDKAYITKTYNMFQLLKYFTETMETYYRQKMIQCINNNLEQFTLSSYKSELREISDMIIEDTATGQFKVRNNKSNVPYFVDGNIHTCSCPLALTGSPCKHLYAVSIAKKFDFSSAVPDDDIIKKELFWIATDTMKSGNFNSIVDVGSESETDTQVGESSSASNIISSVGKNQKEESRKILERVVQNIMEKYDSNSNEFHKAIVTAAVNYQNLNNDREILTALKTFGKGFKK